MPVNESYDRLRVVIETLAYAQPEMPLKDAVAAIFEIERRASSRASSESMPVSHGKGDLAAWINTHGHKHTDSFGVSIVQLINEQKKINAIKVVRSAIGAGLKEAKEGVEEYERLYAPTV